MKCPNCSAECSDLANICEFCSYSFVSSADASSAEITPPIIETPEPSGPPPIPDFASPPVPPSFESDNPYAPSSSATYARVPLHGYDVPNYLPLSIIAAVLSFCCCCVPFGIVPVIFSTQVNSKLAVGDYEGARSASDNAKLWSWISIGIALAVFALNFFVNILAALGGLAGA